jgi:hypothetical protein
MRSLGFKLLIVSFFWCRILVLSQAVFTSASSGNWNSSLTWSITSGSDDNGWPDSNDDVIIDGETVTLTGAVSAKNVTISSGTLDLDEYRLNLPGLYSELINNSTISSDGGSIRLNLYGYIKGSGTFPTDIEYKHDYALFIESDITLTNHVVGANGGIVVETGVVVTIDGTFKFGNTNTGLPYHDFVNRGTLIINNPTEFFLLSGNGKPTNERLQCLLGEIRLPNGGAIPEPEDGGFKNLVLSGTTTSNSSYTLNGNLSNSGDYSSTGSNTVTFNGSSIQSISGSGTSNFEDVSITNSNGINISDASHTFNSSGTLTNQGNLAVDGIFNSTNAAIFNGSSTQIISGSGTSNFQNFSVTNANGININDANHTMNCTGTVDCAGDFQNDGIFISTATITFNGSSEQDISGSGKNTFYNLTLNNASGLRFVNGTDTIREILKSDNGSFTNVGAEVILPSYSDGNGGQLDNLGSNSYTGNITVQRKLVTGSNQGHRMLSSPVQSTTLSHWMDDGVVFSGFTGSTFDTHWWVNTYYYDPSQVAGGEHIDSGWVEVSSISHQTSNYPNLQSTIIFMDQSLNLDISVTGTPNQGTISQNVTKSANSSWNLIANPYPCGLNWSSFSGDADNSEFSGNAHVWNATNGNWTTSLSTISHSQGFFIDAQSSGLVTFKESHKSTSSTSYIKTNNGVNNPLEIQISSDINSFKDYAYLKISQNSTNNFEYGFDERKLFTMLPDYAPSLYFVSDDSIELCHSSISNSHSNSIPLYSRIGSLANGNYTLSFGNLGQFMIGSCIKLIDLHTGDEIDLRVDSTYSFESANSSISPRFLIDIEMDYNINVTNPSCYSSSNGFIEIQGNNIDSTFFNLFSDGILEDSIFTLIDSLTFVDIKSGNYHLETNHVGNCSLESSEIVLSDPDKINSNFMLSITDSIFQDSNNTIYFINKSVGANFYVWDFGDGNYSNEFSPTHTYPNVGEYYVSLTSSTDSSGNCFEISTDFIRVFENTTSLSEISLAEYDLVFDAYQKRLYFSNANNLYIELIDMYGRVIFQKLIPSNNDESFDFSFLKNGLYLVNLFDESSNYILTKKIIIN